MRSTLSSASSRSSLSLLLELAHVEFRDDRRRPFLRVLPTAPRPTPRGSAAIPAGKAERVAKRAVVVDVGSRRRELFGDGHLICVDGLEKGSLTLRADDVDVGSGLQQEGDDGGVTLSGGLAERSKSRQAQIVGPAFAVALFDASVEVRACAQLLLDFLDLSRLAPARQRRLAPLLESLFGHRSLLLVAVGMPSHGYGWQRNLRQGRD